MKFKKQLSVGEAIETVIAIIGSIAAVAGVGVALNKLGFKFPFIGMMLVFIFAFGAIMLLFRKAEKTHTILVPKK